LWQKAVAEQMITHWTAAVDPCLQLDLVVRVLALADPDFGTTAVAQLEPRARPPRIHIRLCPTSLDMGTEAAMEWTTVTVRGALPGEVVPVLLGERLLGLGLATEEMGAITEVFLAQILETRAGSLEVAVGAQNILIYQAWEAGVAAAMAATGLVQTESPTLVVVVAPLSVASLSLARVVVLALSFSR